MANREAKTPYHDGELAVLSEGLPSGIALVTAGTAELFIMTARGGMEQ